MTRRISFSLISVYFCIHSSEEGETYFTFSPRTQFLCFDALDFTVHWYSTGWLARTKDSGIKLTYGFSGTHVSFVTQIITLFFFYSSFCNFRSYAGWTPLWLSSWIFSVRLVRRREAEWARSHAGVSPLLRLSVTFGQGLCFLPESKHIRHRKSCRKVRFWKISSSSANRKVFTRTLMRAAW